MSIKTKIKNSKAFRWIWQLAWFFKLLFERLGFTIGKTARRCGFRDKYHPLKALKDAYSGERCFIIATGPSLTNDDILKLRDEYTFSMNAMCLKYDELSWTPSFYGIQDNNVFHKLKDKIDHEGVKYFFVDGRYKKECKSYPSWLYFPRYAAYNSYDAFFKKKYKVKFSDNANLVVYDGFTITYSLIQLAVYMGFKQIYLLGCDCGYSKDASKRYFVDHGIVGNYLDEATERMFTAYRVADEYAKKHGIEIYNATRGGQLEIFPRVNLDEIVAPK